MNMEACPKYQACFAPVCPLDANWRKARHLNGERVCYYLLEAQKSDANANFEGRGWVELYQAMVGATPDISFRWTAIKYAITQATKTGSRMTTKPPGSQITGEGVTP